MPSPHSLSHVRYRSFTSGCALGAGSRPPCTRRARRSIALGRRGADENGPARTNETDEPHGCPPRAVCRRIAPATPSATLSSQESRVSAAVPLMSSALSTLPENDDAQRDAGSTDGQGGGADRAVLAGHRRERIWSTSQGEGHRSSTGKIVRVGIAARHAKPSRTSSTSWTRPARRSTAAPSLRLPRGHRRVRAMNEVYAGVLPGKAAGTNNGRRKRPPSRRTRRVTVTAVVSASVSSGGRWVVQRQGCGASLARRACRCPQH